MCAVSLPHSSARAFALVAPTVVLAKAKRSWAHAEIKLVTAQGLMGGNAASFRPDAPLTHGALDELAQSQ